MYRKQYSNRAQSHRFSNLCVLNSFLKLFKAQLPISVLIVLYYGSIDDLLQLLVVQVLANHGFQHDEKLTVGDEPVFVNVIDFKSETKPVFLQTFCGEDTKTSDELLEINVA
ncbi:hypothetical protein WICPIJ_006679 [Wickerhamomyces pijperi]|uniref:Uncharacterized protein n=1 Tax=Wickerhamomyces pijperi TaxID=599730 RepID=A0A9P8Q3A2_WICPI|nr:hypothetical protein WICPIJ_006679 [Wickerhamomyces pijperi]